MKRVFNKSPSQKPFRKFDRPPPRKPAPANAAEAKLQFNPENDLIYGVHSVAAALANPKRKCVKLWTTENAAARLKAELPSLPIEPELVHPRLLDHLLKGQDAVHQGLILEAKPLRQPTLEQLPQTGIIVILDQVTDPHNVGAIMRSCAAFNVTALVVTERHAAETNGAFMKAASGAFELVPYVSVANLARALITIKTSGFKLVGLDSEATTSLSEISHTRPLGLVLGAEGRGLRQLTRNTCDHLTRIDMPGQIKSLNVSIAAAISLYALNSVS